MAQDTRWKIFVTDRDNKGARIMVADKRGNPYKILDKAKADAKKAGHNYSAWTAMPFHEG